MGIFYFILDTYSHVIVGICIKNTISAQNNHPNHLNSLVLDNLYLHDLIFYFKIYEIHLPDGCYRDFSASKKMLYRDMAFLLIRASSLINYGNNYLKIWNNSKIIFQTDVPPNILCWPIKFYKKKLDEHISMLCQDRNVWYIPSNGDHVPVKTIKNFKIKINQIFFHVYIDVKFGINLHW